MVGNKLEKTNKLDYKIILFWAIIIVSITVPIVFFVAKNQIDKVQFASSEMFELVFENIKEFDELNTTSKGFEIENLISQLDEVITSYPSSIASMRSSFYKGYVYYYAGKPEEAEDLFLEFIEKHKNSYLTSKAYYFLSFIYFELDKTEEAIKSLNNILEVKKDSYYASLAYYRLGQIYESINDTENALKYYNELITKHETSSQVADAKKKIALLNAEVNLFK